MAKFRVLLADDHAVVRQGLRALIDSQPDFEVVGEASDGESARRMADEIAPDVVVMDVSMPGLTVDRATERIKGEHPEIKVLALTVYEDKNHLRKLLKAGASGYVLKLATGEELIGALRVVATGGVYLDPVLAVKLIGDIVSNEDGPKPVAETPLTDRELQIMLRVAQGFSNKEIAAQHYISVKTVETHKLRSMEKLGRRGRSDVVRYALRNSWLTNE